jgi:hypothetical protein
MFTILNSFRSEVVVSIPTHRLPLCGVGEFVSELPLSIHILAPPLTAPRLKPWGIGILRVVGPVLIMFSKSVAYFNIRPTPYTMLPWLPIVWDEEGDADADGTIVG